MLATKRRKQTGIAAVISAVLLGVLVFAYYRFSTSTGYIDPADHTLVLRGQKVYANDCAACHGANLQGQANWRERKPNGRLPAPPHDVSGHTWHHPDAVLLDLIKNGLVPGVTAPQGYESDMPAFKTKLSDQDIVAVIAYIKSFWPPNALAAQKEVTQEHPTPR
ncbi:cytochrome c [Paralcaligenes sp. KSB-10]|jgi:mono/diheme cytochrome c family protein|uniref:c-type cytochrome n=1 Tax=Paralcaligenes sp. KSB-10 TaxID=2901142 RepID=UPI001E5C0B38|nr:cytochrome c [Paralcaligenes sp. KSB-10]UHL65197.1 cytochrome c [Paralcaligenes sp. KSB-10]